MRKLQTIIPKALVLAFVGAFAMGIFVFQSGPTPAGQPSLDFSEKLTAAAFASVVVADREERRLSIVAPIPSSVTLQPGETIAFSAVAFDQSGREILGLIFQWKIVDQSAGTITSTGIFQAGPLEGDYSGAVAVDVGPDPRFGSQTAQGFVDISVQPNFGERVAASIRLLPPVAEAAPGQTIFLTALGMDSTGALLPSGRPTWKMVDSRAGSVTVNGGFTAGEFAGSFPGAITVTLQTRLGPDSIVDSLDVLVVEAISQVAEFSGAILPQTVVLRPGQTFAFEAIVIDLRNGGRLQGIPVFWRISDPLAGIVSPDGRFIASLQPGEYSSVVEAIFDMSGLPNQADIATARSTVIIVEDTPSPAEAAPSDQLFLFPQRITLSSGESAEVNIAGLFERLEYVDIDWEIDKRIGIFPEPGRIKAGSNSGVYLGAIKATVTLEVKGVVVTHELYSDLVIVGPLAMVEISPKNVTTTPGARVQFFALAKDASGIPLDDVNFRWSMENESAGRISSVGTFVATDTIGEFQDVIKVVAVQLVR